MIFGSVGLPAVMPEPPPPPPPPNPPTASFTGNPLSGHVPLTITFTNSSISASLYSWDFGDSTSSVDTNPVHVYNTDGVYNVSLTASGSGGSNTLTQTNYISASTVIGTFFSGSFSGDNLSALSFAYGGCFGPSTTIGEFTSSKSHEKISDVGFGTSGQVVMQSSNTFLVGNLYRYDALISLGMSATGKYPLQMWGLASNFHDPYCTGLYDYYYAGFQLDIETGIYSFIMYAPPLNITWSTGIQAVNDVNTFTKFSISQPVRGTIKAYINDVLLNTWTDINLWGWTTDQWFCMSTEWYSPYVVDAYMKSLNIQVYNP